MEHDARDVANELLRRAWSSSQTVTHLKIMKLVYFCHAWRLGLYHTPFLMQPIEAWKYGPVVRDLYRSLRRFGGEPVNRLISIESGDYDANEEEFIDQIWTIYGRYTGPQLSALTHAPGTPWHVTWHQRGQSAVIPDPNIEEHYAREAREARK